MTKINHSLIESLNFKCWYEDTETLPNSSIRKYQKRIDPIPIYNGLEPCACNNKLFVNIHTYEYNSQERLKDSIQIELCHTHNDKEWVDLTIYSIDPEDFNTKEKINTFVRKIIKLWKFYSEYDEKSNSN